MLTVHVLNVGKGDTIILQRTENEETHFGVVDSCDIPRRNPSVLISKLRQLGATELSFVALTHPHHDHYSGMYDVFQTFKVHKFYSFPVTAFVQGESGQRLDNLMHAYRIARQRTTSAAIKKNIEEFIRMLVYVRDNLGPDNWHELAGLDEGMHPLGFSQGISLRAILPVKRFKGELFQILDGDPVSYLETPNLNKFSLAIIVNYKGHKIVLGGDGTEEAWMEHKRQLHHQNLDATAAKLPHHGSRIDSSADVLTYIFGDGSSGAVDPAGENSKKIALISAIGDAHHPSKNVLTEIGSRNYHPYCTSFSVHCGAKIRSVVSSPDLHPKMNSFLSMNLDPSSVITQACQGDISFIIDDNGNANVERQYDTLCPYRDVGFFN